MDSTSLLAGASRPKLLPEGPVPTALQPGSAGVQQSIRCTHIQQVPASGQVRQQHQSRCGSCAVPGVRFRMTGAARGVPGKPHRGPPRLWDVRRDRRRKLKSGRNSTTDRAQEDQARLARWHAGRAGTLAGRNQQLNAASGLQPYVAGLGPAATWSGSMSVRIRVPLARVPTN